MRLNETTYKGVGDPHIIKKYKIVRGDTPKFRSCVVESAFLRKLEGGVLNKYKIWSLNGLAKMQYWQKILLDDLPGGRAPPQYKKIQNSEGRHHEILILCG